MREGRKEGKNDAVKWKGRKHTEGVAVAAAIFAFPFSCLASINQPSRRKQIAVIEVDDPTHSSKTSYSYDKGGKKECKFYYREMNEQ